MFLATQQGPALPSRMPASWGWSLALQGRAAPGGPWGPPRMLLEAEAGKDPAGPGKVASGWGLPGPCTAPPVTVPVGRHSGPSPEGTAEVTPLVSELSARAALCPALCPDVAFALRSGRGVRHRPGPSGGGPGQQPPRGAGRVPAAAPAAGGPLHQETPRRGLKDPASPRPAAVTAPKRTVIPRPCRAAPARLHVRPGARGGARRRGSPARSRGSLAGLHGVFPVSS